MQFAQSRREQIRQGRIAAASQAASAEASGVARSSGAEGGQSSIISQLNYNLSFLDTMATLSDQASDQLGKAMTWSNRAQTFMGLANLTLTAGSAFAPSASSTKPTNTMGGIGSAAQSMSNVASWTPGISTKYNAGGIW